MSHTRVIPLDDGETVLVHANSEQSVIDRTRELFCPAMSDVPIPGPIPGRTCPCGRRRGHHGPHRWPADTGQIATWEDTPHA